MVIFVFQRSDTIRDSNRSMSVIVDAVRVCVCVCVCVCVIV